jgi:membrane-anchored protein YejM (alkaline phosphatase superfamily)
MAVLWALAFTVMAFWALRALTLVLITAGMIVLQKIK